MTTPITVRDRIRAVLDGKAFDHEHTAESRAERIESLIPSEGWEPVQAALVQILRDDSVPYHHWLTAAEVFWGAVLDKRSLKTNLIIGLVYKRLRPDEGSTESNLAWSIASKLKGVSYLSDYNPATDPEVLSAMNTSSEA